MPSTPEHGKESLGLSSLTDKQIRAVTRSNGLICVEAGAGTGKTTVIAQRYLYLLLELGLSPSQILCITYTRKAAQEMKHRILHGLRRTAEPALIREVENGYIHTIHGFCERLLRENPFDASLDPQFVVLDQGSAQRILDQAFRACYARCITRKDGSTELLSEPATLHVSGLRSEPLGALREEVVGVLEQLRSYGMSHEECEAWCSELEQEIDLAPDIALEQATKGPLREAHRALESCVSPAMVALRERIDTVLKEPAERLRPSIEVLLNSIRDLRHRDIPTSDAHALSNVKRLLRTVNLAVSDCLPERECRCAARGAALLRFALEVWTTYDHMKLEEAGLDFSDLEMRSVDMLENCYPVRERYQRRFEHVLVDEFQDVNPLQARLISVLTSGENVCFVGDPRQAIYGFRYGDVSQFQELSAQVRSTEAQRPEAACHVSLSESFRARQELLAFVAWLMEWCRRPEFGKLESLREPVRTDNPSVEIWIAGKQAPSDPEMVAKGIRNLKNERGIEIFDEHGSRTLEWRDIAVLFRYTHRITAYRDALRSAGVPAHIVRAGRNFYARYEVRDLRNALQTLLDPYDDLALACLLRSPMVGLSLDALTLLAATRNELSLYEQLKEKHLSLPEDDRSKSRRFLEWFEPLSLYADRLPIAETIERLMTETLYRPKILSRPDGAQQLANLRKLHQLAFDSPEATIAQFVECLDALERIAIREGDAPLHDDDANAVKLMTVHGAKGLEFPITVLADLDAHQQSSKSSTLLDPRERLLASRTKDEESLLYRQILSTMNSRESEEDWRLLYVALTRAREMLIITLPSVPHGARAATWGSVLRRALLRGPSPTAPTVVRPAEGVVVGLRVFEQDD